MAAAPVTAKYLDVLAAADVFTVDNAFAMGHRRKVSCRTDEKVGIMITMPTWVSLSNSPPNSTARRKSPIGGRSRRGVPGGQATKAIERQPPTSHTQYPWAMQPYERLDQPV